MKLKKSLLVAPALGVLLIAAAGSVGGTVAWFTSTNVFDTSISTFGVTRVDGNLKCTMDVTSEIGTRVANNVVSVGTDADLTNMGVTGIAPALLTDASFDHVNKSLCTDNDGGKGEVFKALAKTATGTNDWMYSASAAATADPVADPKSAIYYAVSWKMTFEYEFGNTITNDQFLFLNTDTALSHIYGKSTLANASGAKEATKAFRVAFVSASRATVWAPEQDAAKCTYVSGTDHEFAVKSSEGVTAAIADGTKLETLATDLKSEEITLTYTDSAWKKGDTALTATQLEGLTITGDPDADSKIVLTSNAVLDYEKNNSSKYTHLVANDNASTASYIVPKDDGASPSTISSAATNCIGVFHATTANQTVQLEFVCTAWFEGSDENIINTAKLESFSVGMAFFTREGAHEA